MNPLQTLQVVRVVIASPSDVKAERNIIVKVVEELNQTIAKEHALYIDLVRWETEVAPGFDMEGPQAAIDKALRIEESHLLIGIFWKRFGTPVKDAKSGTEHEFRKAHEAWKHNGYPKIMFYFNRQLYSLDTPEEADQLRQVLAFKKSFPEEGLWWAYNGKDEFEQSVRRHVRQFILTMSNNTTSTTITKQTHSPPPLDEQISQWLKAQRRKSTRDRYEVNMTQFRQILCKSGLDLDSEHDMRIAWLAEDWAYGNKGGGIAPTTFNNRLSIVSSFYRFAIKRKWATSNPILLVERREEYNVNAAEALDIETVKNGLKSIDRSTLLGKRNYALLCLLLTTGRHLSEVAALRCGDIAREKNSMIITFKLIRSGEMLRVTLFPGVAKALNEYISTAYPGRFTADSPLWISGSRQNKGQVIGETAFGPVCKRYLGTSKVEATRHTYEAMKHQRGIRGIEKLLGIF